MAYTKIADTLEISRITVKNRMDRMIKEDLIVLSAKTNLIKQGGKIAILGLEVKSKEHWDECLNKIRVLPWILMGFRSMGKSNLRLMIFGETDEILERNINEFRYFHCVNFIEVEVLGVPLINNF